jgi:hypothetical protein
MRGPFALGRRLGAGGVPADLRAIGEVALKSLAIDAVKAHMVRATLLYLSELLLLTAQSYDL